MQLIPSVAVTYPTDLQLVRTDLIGQYKYWLNRFRNFHGLFLNKEPVGFSRNAGTKLVHRDYEELEQIIVLVAESKRLRSGCTRNLVHKLPDEVSINVHEETVSKTSFPSHVYIHFVCALLHYPRDHIARRKR